MEDFLVKKKEGEDGKWYMYIGFQDIRLDATSMVNCFGSALIHHDDKSQYWINYSFHHSLDWNEYHGMVVRPIKNCFLTREQIQKIGNDIFYNIREFVSMMN